jgi:hypothetical protein
VAEEVAVAADDEADGRLSFGSGVQGVFTTIPKRCNSPQHFPRPFTPTIIVQHKDDGNRLRN